ncbi:hypothetical protein PN36_30290 [Candidatus Thiomargarita nelsonii]|uniref:BACON domain-containing protein n=1 Tax=Candidatus Thiomargarita nelsonii TaxID=1003181 RepID=A0A0A6RMT2_9GAMM|nr:hypothetical protein PN36_30290 [Candidatus Thiomargarita nelsonii]
MNAQTNNASNPIQVFLESGTYIVEPIGTDKGGTYNAWNAWGLNTSGTVEFYINDPSSELSNNLGGISRKISLFKCADAAITPTNISHSSSTETGTVTISASSDCSWTARSNENWITITAGESQCH